jgi:hypothetical protein
MGDGLFRQSREWGDVSRMGWEDRLVASCPRFVTCAAFLKRKYNVSHEDIQFIAQTLYSGLSGGGEEPQESQGLVNVERESAFDLKQIQMVSLSGQSTMHTKMFTPSKAGRTAVIAAYVACPVGLGQAMQAEIDAAIQRTFNSARLGGTTRGNIELTFVEYFLARSLRAGVNKNDELYRSLREPEPT